MNETFGSETALNKRMSDPGYSTLPLPDLQAIRNEAINGGAVDPMTLRFQIVEYHKASGEQLGILARDLGFRAAIEKAASLIPVRDQSHFCLEPVGFIQ
ncbi:MAG: hypothetical protein ABSG41_08960 [Bryobacteraceae bacterium]